jgi:hypothetical protein
MDDMRAGINISGQGTSFQNQCANYTTKQAINIQAKMDKTIKPCQRGVCAR